MQTGGLETANSIILLARGIHLQKDPDQPRDMEIGYMRVAQAQHLERVSTCRAGISGTLRMPVQLSWFAGAGLGAGTGTASPAINGLRG